MDDEIKKKVQAAIAAGADPAEAVKRGQALQASRTTAPAAPVTPSPAPAATAPVVSTQPPATTPPAGQGGLLGLLGNILAPVLKGAKYVGEGVASGVDLAANAGNILQGKPLPAYQPKFLDPQEYQQATEPNSANPSDKSFGSFITSKPGERAIKTGAGAASFAVPVAKGASLAQLLRAGAASGALQGVSNVGDNATPEEAVKTIATDTGLGAAGAGLFGKLFGNAAKSGAAPEVIGNSAPNNLLTKAGNKVIASQFDLPRSAGRAFKPLETAGKMAEYGFSNVNDYVPAADAVTGSNGILTKLTRDAVAGAKPVNTNGIINMAKDLAGDPSITTSTEKKFISFVEKGITQLYGGSKGSLATAANPSDTFGFIQQLEAEAGQLTRGRSPLAISQNDRALSRAYQSLADELRGRLFQDSGADNVLVNHVVTPENIAAISSISPKLGQDFAQVQNVGDLRKLASTFVNAGKIARETEAAGQLTFKGLGDAGKGAARLVPSVGDPLAPLRPILGSDAVNAQAGNALRNAGQKFSNFQGAVRSISTGNPQLDAILGATKNAVTSPIAGAEVMTNALGGNSNAQPTQTPQGAPAPAEPPTDLNTSATPGTGESARKITPEQMQAVLLSPNISKATKDRMKQAYDVQEASIKTSLGTTEQQNRRASLKPAVVAINGIRKTGVDAGGPQNKLALFQLQALGGAGVDPKIASLNQQYELLKQNVVRALQGARMSDNDIKTAANYVPNITDTPAISKVKLDNLEAFINSLSEGGN